ncbi:hypothetical protein S40293_03740 [Stachybotrys chartarum IBT 40293]|nr:hypothetical protein S40293_03740 [Stachybotrys chartarum IBT 40293]
MPLHLSSRPINELRSYRFYLEVTAPSLAGAMHGKFWLDEIPRLCSQDSAIWHGIVSLSSAYESYVSGAKPKTIENKFTLQQCNSAIRSMIGPGSPQNWWRALFISTIFTCISILDDDYDQAQIQFKSAYNLLREFDTETGLEKSNQSRSAGPRNLYSASSIPMSLPTLRSILIGFEMRNNRLSSTRVSQLPTLLSRDDSMSQWRSYAAPQHPSAVGHYLTVANLGQAVSIAEILFYHLAISSQQYANEMKASYAADKRCLTETRWQQSRSKGNSAHCLCFKEIQKAVGIFSSEFEVRQWPRAKAAEKAQLQRAFLSLRLMQATNRFMLQDDPDEPNRLKRTKNLPGLCTHIVDLAEEMMSLERTYGCKRSGDTIPNSTVMNPLYVVAMSGFGAETRQRAVHLLRRPRVEGLWDSLMAASLGDIIQSREKAASQEYSKKEYMKEICIDDYTSRGWEAEAAGQQNIHPLARVCKTIMALGKGKQASIGLRTWWEWLEDLPGHEVTIQW